MLRGDRNMSKWKILIPFFLMLFAVSLTGCGCFGGGNGDAEIQTTTKTTTMGQDLIDLKKAHDDGIISDKEYEKAREKILKEAD